MGSAGSAAMREPLGHQDQNIGAVVLYECRRDSADARRPAHGGFLGSATSGGCPDLRSVSRSLRPLGMVAARSLLLSIPPKQFVHAERPVSLRFHTSDPTLASTPSRT